MFGRVPLLWSLSAGLFLLPALCAQVDVHYVSPSGGNTSPFTNWSMAATTIQAAVDAATAGDTVMVSNGVYATGGRVVHGSMTNRVAIMKPIRVQSVNGPAVTIIKGAKDPITTNGDSAVRCVYVGTNAMLLGFTLTNGATRESGDWEYELGGGGARCEPSGVLSNCTLIGNTAGNYGGGSYYGTLNNCALIGNTATYAGGGAYAGTLNNCTLIGNTARDEYEAEGGGAYGGTLNNCTLAGNTSSNRGGGSFGSMLSSCTLSGNMAYVGGGSYSGTLNNCTLSGNTAEADGGGSCFGGLNNCRLSWNSAGDSGGGSYYGTLSNCTLSGNSASNWGGGGSYYGTLNNCTLSMNTAFFDGGGALGGTLNNCTLIGNAAGDFGGGSSDGTLSNCTLSGNWSEYGGGAANGSLYNCVLSGNTASNSGGGSYGGSLYNCTLSGNSSYIGGGVNAGTLNNCTLTANSAVHQGGGAIWSALTNCMLIGNVASNSAGGGTASSTLKKCTLRGNTTTNEGGGAHSGTLTDCVLIGNVASHNGGGVNYATLYNCVLIGNTASNSGGASHWGTLNNCTLTGNSAGSSAGGSYRSTVNNCIVYYNTAPASPNFYLGALSYACTTPSPGGVGNITNNPQFVSLATSNYHLSASSPCIDRGSNIYVQGTTDLDGNLRIANGIVDMGAYEFQIPVGYGSWAGAITNGMTNYGDSATGDGYPNLLKYATGSSATNSDSLAKLTAGFSNDQFFLGFNWNTGAVDVTLTIEGAMSFSNGASWKGIATNRLGSWGGATNVVISNGVPAKVSVRDFAPATNRYLRLRVTRP